MVVAPLVGDVKLVDEGKADGPAGSTLLGAKARAFT